MSQPKRQSRNDIFSVRNKCQTVNSKLIFSFINIDKNYIRAITALRSIDYTSVVYYGSRMRFNVFPSLIKEMVYVDDLANELMTEFIICGCKRPMLSEMLMRWKNSVVLITVINFVY